MGEMSEYRIPLGEDELIVTPKHITSPLCSIRLEPYEAAVLYLLYSAQQKCVPHPTICAAIDRARPDRAQTRHPSNYLSKLKNKLNSATAGKVRVHGVRGEGYRLLY